MAYKLQKYENCACTRVKRFYASANELAEALDYYERNAEYRNFERSAIWSIWRMISRFDCYALYDKMREEVSDFNDSHIETSMRNAIKKNYGTLFANFSRFIATQIITRLGCNYA